MLGSRKNSKPEKCLKMPQNPTRQVHPGRCTSHHFLQEKQGRETMCLDELDNQPKYTPKRQARKPKKAMAMTRVSRGAPWFPVELI